MVEPESFPDDENGDVLRRMQANGDDLSKARDIDFSVVFQDEAAAKRFVELVDRKSSRVALEHRSNDSERAWDVTVSRNMVPTHSAITQFEDELQGMASKFAGHNDGWGCFSV